MYFESVGVERFSGSNVENCVSVSVLARMLGSCEVYGVLGAVRPGAGFLSRFASGSCNLSVCRF